MDVSGVFCSGAASEEDADDSVDLSNSADVVEIELASTLSRQLPAIIEGGNEEPTPDEMSLATIMDDSGPEHDGREYEVTFESLRFELASGARVVRGVHGQLKPGRLTVICGASGSGKTTLLNLLIGKTRLTSGTITMTVGPIGSHDSYTFGTRGAKSYSCERGIGARPWKLLVGLVPQEATLSCQMTVVDNITFAARLRLPRSWPEARKQRAVMSVLRDLKLGHVMHTRIGDELRRGVSGGERKRVNLAIELVAHPRVLMLDEPTSGLDSSSAAELTTMLKRIAETVRT